MHTAEISPRLQLQVLNQLPDKLWTAEVDELDGVLGNPTLIHLEGQRQPPLLISILLHGDEHTSWLAVRSLLHNYANRELPRSVSIFIGNVQAARYGLRALPTQPDYNRIWQKREGFSATPEQAIAEQVIEQMTARGVFACIDIHNNSGKNPYFACLDRLDRHSLFLASLFSNNVLYLTQPAGRLASAFAQICPTVVLECGQSGKPEGVAHTLKFLITCLEFTQLPSHPVHLDVFQTISTIKIPAHLSFTFGEEEKDISLIPNLDSLNFVELPAGICLGRVSPGVGVGLEAWTEDGLEISAQLFHTREGKLLASIPATFSMLTQNEQAIRQDCLGYLMRRCSY